MASNVSLNSTDSDVFFVEQLSSEPSPQRNNSPNILNSTELSRTHTKEMPTLSSVISPEPDIVIIEEESNDPTIPYVFGAQQTFAASSLNNLNIAPKSLNISATFAVVEANSTQNNKNFSPQSMQPSEPSPISTPLSNLSTIDG